MNISDFARYAGVSKAAVSRYFNHGYLSADKRAQIERAAEETGYTPSAQARTLRTRRTQQIGVIIPKLSSESCARVVEGVGAVLDSQGYQLLQANTDNDPRREVEFLDLFRHNHVDGVIFLASVFTPDHLAVLQNMRVPVVIVGQKLDGYYCVSHDDLGATRALTRHLLECGCRRPGYLGVTLRDEAAGLARREGFAAALREAGLRPEPRRMGTAQCTIESGYEQAARLLRGPESPDGLLCATDYIAVGVMQYCREQGIHIPQDLKLAGVGDTMLSKVAAIPLTTAHLHYRTSGKQAAAMLLDLLEHTNVTTSRLELGHDLVFRQSTGD